MARFHITFDGTDDQSTYVDYPSAEEARNAAIVMLGDYLHDHPEYAYQQHWRVELRDSAERLIYHVIVATVRAAPPLNWESFDQKPSTYRKDSRPISD